ncbi:BlaI/MecI/CopY family transcriptional regulator [Paenibacillus chondroitinus]|uniref:BlaI/MecI/CopY family transcriptional regulator n=1 Tax=Paenibacillus chondroitinus TaxID=59842 RepID=A0ABU6DGK7_9BACL|nr:MULTISPECIES: BlaI/MecI/CopY family transcriptional regulator [Paenibacillus]MCY9659478.1 BlaI/MecI/CopY family transcriptional regulator [Paenibacillus anseongense]MEB4796873.1 BlaI/MecI/CopY family transcriptional regulator [Paenibacillus chondroitinus]
MKIKTYQVQEKGLYRFLGSLEVQIMEIMWMVDKVSIKDVQELLSEVTPYSFTTIMTVMNRLYDKGLLEKKTLGKGRTKSTLFRALSTKDDFLAEQTRDVTRGLMDEFEDYVVTHFIDAMDEADPSLIQKLEQKLEAIKKRTDR